jgi:hypothetical protein
MRVLYRTQLAFLMICVLAACTKSADPAPGAVEPKAPETPGGNKANFLPAVPVLRPDPTVVGPTLVCNGSFEEWDAEKVVCWDIQGEQPVKTTPSTTLATDGSQSLQLEVRDKARTEVSQEITLKALQKYLIRCMVLPKNFSGSVLLKTSGGNGAVEATKETTGRESAWTLLSVEVEPPPYVAKLKIGLTVEGSPGDAGKEAFVLIDNFEVLPTRPTIRANLLRNSGFTEGVNGLGGWQVDSSLPVSRADSGFLGEVPYCLRIELPGNFNLGIMQTVLNLVPGRRYTLRGYIKAENVTGKASIEVQHGTKGYTAFLKRTNEVSGTADWTPVTLDFTVPDGMTGANIYLRRPAAATDTPDIGFLSFAQCELFMLDE